MSKRAYQQQHKLWKKIPYLLPWIFTLLFSLSLSHHCPPPPSAARITYFHLSTAPASSSSSNQKIVKLEIEWKSSADLRMFSPLIHVPEKKPNVSPKKKSNVFATTRRADRKKYFSKQARANPKLFSMCVHIIREFRHKTKKSKQVHRPERG